VSALIIIGGDPSKVNVNGYLKGDLLAANAAGSLQAFHVGTQAEMVTVNTSATQSLAYRGTPTPLTDAPTIATDASTGRSFSVTLGGNRTLGAPTNPGPGQMVIWEFKQDGIGGRTIALDLGVGGFKFGTDLTSISLSATAGAVDVLGCRYNATANKWWVIAFLRGY